MTIPELVGADDAALFAAELLTQIGAASPDLIYAKDTESRMVFANQAVLTALDKSWDEIRGRSELDWHHDAAEARAIIAADARIIAEGRSESLEEVITSPSGDLLYYLSRKSPLRAPDGRIIGMFGISTDITLRKQAEQLRQLLLDELEHRVRNTLSLVQIMARQTLKQTPIDKAVWASFDGRLQAMAQAHNVLTREHWDGAGIREIVGDALKVHGAALRGQFAIDGEDIWVDSRNALALALALHELGTNAVKYGALSVPGGRVSIRWTVERDRPAGAVVDLVWQERGGPPVVPPSHRGFGSRLIAQAFDSATADAVHIDYAAEGLRFRVRFAVGARLG